MKLNQLQRHSSYGHHCNWNWFTFIPAMVFQQLAHSSPEPQQWLKAEWPCSVRAIVQISWWTFTTLQAEGSAQSIKRTGPVTKLLDCDLGTFFVPLTCIEPELGNVLNCLHVQLKLSSCACLMLTSSLDSLPVSGFYTTTVLFCWASLPRWICMPFDIGLRSHVYDRDRGSLCPFIYCSTLKSY